VSDTFQTVAKSPNFNGCLSSVVQQNQSNMLNSNGITQSQVMDLEIRPLLSLVATHKIA
jgi:hypothetical protein